MRRSSEMPAVQQSEKAKADQEQEQEQARKPKGKRDSAGRSHGAIAHQEAWPWGARG